MLVELSPLLLIASNVVAWLGWSFAVGGWQSRRPAEDFVPGRFGRIRRWERHGRAWRRLGVHRWKDRLPEAGTWFGGLSKRSLPGRGEGGLARFAQECLRAERTHAWIIAALPVFLLWNPWAGMAINLVYAVAANVPCLLAARYNRARLERYLASRQGPM